MENSKRKMCCFRQGEIIIVPRDLTNKNSRTTNYIKKGDGIIREGEASGHFHKLSGGTLYVNPRDENDMWLDNQLETIELTHDEHAPIKIPKGAWKVIIQREYSDEMNTYVRD